MIYSETHLVRNVIQGKTPFKPRYIVPKVTTKIKLIKLILIVCSFNSFLQNGHCAIILVISNLNKVDQSDLAKLKIVFDYLKLSINEQA